MACVREDIETITELQESELQLLENIYIGDVTDLRKQDAWKVHRPPEIKVVLQPQDSVNAEEAHVQVDLIVNCTENYPKEVPTLKLDNARGLSTQQIGTLQDELQTLSQKLVGEVMLLELCQHAQEFLHHHNKPPPKSFYEQMMTNKKMQEEQQAKEHEKKMEFLRKQEEREVQQIDEEIHRRQEAVKEEARRRRENYKQAGIDRQSTSSEPSNPTGDPFGRMTPIPKDTEQRQRSSTSPDRRTPGTQALVSQSGSYHKPERKSPDSLSIGARYGRTSTPLARRDSEEGVDDEPITSGTRIVAFNTKTGRVVHQGKVLGHGARGSVTYAAMDTHTGEIVCISEWTLKWRHLNRKLNMQERERDEEEATKYIKQVAAIEQEMVSLVRLKHKHLLHYQAFKYEQESGKITIYLLLDFAGGGSLASHLRRREAIPMNQMRTHTLQILEALAYLHDKAVTHKDLRASSIFLDQDGQIRLGDYSLVKRLRELVVEVANAKPGVRFEDHDMPPTIGRGGKKGDIYRLGIVLLSLAAGRPVTEAVPDIPSTLPSEFHDFITKCLMTDERHRWSAHELQEHVFVKTPIFAQPGLAEPARGALNRQNGHDPNADEGGGDLADIPFIPASDSGSRLQNEFEILKWLGKGGFGDVIKVRNKLDGRFYAIKRIRLNPSKKAFTKKITREVKLLSRLNHENVVRYYTSWIETSQEVACDYSTSPSSSLSKSHISAHATDPSGFGSHSPNPLQGKKKVTATPLTKVTLAWNCAQAESLGFADDVEQYAPTAGAERSVEWGVAGGGSMRCDAEDSSSDEDLSSDEEDEDEDDIAGFLGLSFAPESDSDDYGIVFEHTGPADITQDSQARICSPEKDERTESGGGDGVDGGHVVVPSTSSSPPRLQFLYIQMEFCDKSTLRDCIDAGLYKDVDRVWRLFREIIEGLLHIHDRGMIHRDLKPVNIFLDSNDHVKIGDFGLATTNIISLQQHNLIEMTIYETKTCTESRSESLGDGNLTGKVGTALYVAPEMMNSTIRVHYSQKVDIYSLGVMFFEMCYCPLPTGMERVTVLTSLRQPTIDLPDDFDTVELTNQVTIMKWLLDHDPSGRPTAKELLQSDWLPPPQMEEAELNEILRSAIANRDGKSYQRMMGAIFAQNVTYAMDYTYDSDLYKGAGLFTRDYALLQEHVADTLCRVFRHHGAVRVATPLLMPKTRLLEMSESYVCLMNHSGGLVALPHDPRMPFARFLARNGVSSLKRYCIEKVYRENRLYGSHPKEITACSFDIVTPTTASLLPDAEVIGLVFEVIAEFPRLNTKKYFLRMSHTELLKAVLLHCGVPEERHPEVYAILGDPKLGRRWKMQVQTRLYSLSLSEDVVTSLFTFIEKEASYSTVVSMLRRITKTKGQASSLAKKALHEMEAIQSYLDALNIKPQTVLALKLVNSIHHFSGVVFQVVATVMKKKRQIQDVLAAGGRYDHMVTQFRKPGSGEGPLHQCAVGVSIAFEKILAAATDDENRQQPSPYDVLVCSLGHKAYVKEKLAMVKDLWNAGINADVTMDTSQGLEELQDFCRSHHISHLVILKDIENGTARVRTLDGRSAEKKIFLSEVPEHILQKMQSAKVDVETSSVVKSSTITTQLSGEGWSAPGSGAWSGTGASGNGLPLFNITFIHPDNTKVSKNTRRLYENQIYATLSTPLTHISQKSHVEIIGLDLNAVVLKSIAVYLDLDGEETAFEASIATVMEKLPRHRKYLTKICDNIHELKFDSKKSNHVIILYGLKDESYRILL